MGSVCSDRPSLAGSPRLCRSPLLIGPVRPGTVATIRWLTPGRCAMRHAQRPMPCRQRRGPPRPPGQYTPSPPASHCTTAETRPAPVTYVGVEYMCVPGTEAALFGPALKKGSAELLILVMDGFWSETRGDALYTHRYMSYGVQPSVSRRDPPRLRSTPPSRALPASRSRGPDRRARSARRGASACSSRTGSGRVARHDGRSRHRRGDVVSSPGGQRSLRRSWTRSSSSSARVGWLWRSAAAMPRR